MAIEVRINNSSDARARYITYAPSPCQVRQTPAAAPVTAPRAAARAETRAGGVCAYVLDERGRTAYTVARHRWDESELVRVAASLIVPAVEPRG